MSKKPKKKLHKPVNTWKWRIYKAGLTMEQFCVKTERAQSQLSEWVTGSKVPTLSNVEKMEEDLKALGV